MGTNPFTWILNQIRLGYNKATTLFQGKARFPSVDPENVQSNWAVAWGAKIIGSRMQANQDATLSDTIFSAGINTGMPDVRSADDAFVSYTGVKAYNEFDFSVTSKTGTGGDTQYGTWRFFSNGDDTYQMIKETVEETIIKEYARGKYGTIFLLNVFVIPRNYPWDA